jgi:hypothetical protein
MVRIQYTTITIIYNNNKIEITITITTTIGILCTMSRNVLLLRSVPG